MSSEHNVSIYVFRRTHSALEYLFVRRAPRREFDWNPLSTPLHPDESLRRAAYRAMSERWSAPEPRLYVDLHSCQQQTYGEFELVNWAVGYGVPARFEPRRFAPEFDDVRWEPLAAGFQLLVNESCRQALFRLHLWVLGKL